MTVAQEDSNTYPVIIIHQVIIFSMVKHRLPVLPLRDWPIRISHGILQQQVILGLTVTYGKAYSILQWNCFKEKGKAFLPQEQKPFLQNLVPVFHRRI